MASIAPDTTTSTVDPIGSRLFHGGLGPPVSRGDPGPRRTSVSSLILLTIRAVIDSESAARLDIGRRVDLFFRGDPNRQFGRKFGHLPRQRGLSQRFQSTPKPKATWTTADSALSREPVWEDPNAMVRTRSCR